MEHYIGSIAILYIVASWVSPCSIKKLKFENIIFQRYQSLYSHSAGGCSKENRFLNFNILMVLGDNYAVTIYKNIQRNTATLFSNKVSVEILDLIFSDSLDRQASNHYASK